MPRGPRLPPDLDLGEHPAAYVTACVEIIAADPILTHRAQIRTAEIVSARKVGRPRKTRAG